MRSIKETLTALTSGDTAGAVRVKREEHEPISDERFRLIVNSVTKIAISVVVAVIVVNCDREKLGMLAVLAGAGLLALVIIEVGG